MSAAELTLRKPTLHPADAVLSGACGVLIPAFNEQATLRSVVEVALSADLGPVLVVDDGSTDATAELALNTGAGVLRLPENVGKGGAVFAGTSALQTDVVLLVDADLTGLTPRHLRDLAAPLLAGTTDMTRGVFAGGRLRTTAVQRLTPQLNGQRAIRREKLLSVPDLANSRYGIEVAITKQCKRARWRTEDVTLPGVSQVMKEEKRGFRQGFQVRLRMYRDILRTLLKNFLTVKD